MNTAVFIGVFLVFSFLIIKKVFFISKEISTIDEYLFYKNIGSDAGLDKSQAWVTSVASNFQNASVLVIGLHFGFSYGLTMLWTALTFTTGILLLKHLFTRSNKAGKASYINKSQLPYVSMLKENKNSIINHYDLVIYFAVLGTAFLEIWLTVGLTGEVITGSQLALSLSKNQLATLIGLALSVLLLTYVYLGGYKAVVDTDKIQLTLIITVLLILLLGTFIQAFVLSNTFLLERFMFGESGVSLISQTSFWALIIGILFLNVFWQLVDPQQWQRARASKTAETYVQSLNNASLGTILTWSVPVISGAIISATYQGDTSFAPSIPFMNSINFINSNLGETLTAGFLGVLVLGFFAAAISSADTAIICFVSKIVQLSKKKNSLNTVRKLTLVSTVIVLIIASALYLKDSSIENVIFSIYTGVIFLAAPLIYYIRNHGDLLFNETASFYIKILFILFTAISIVINFTPSISENWPSLPYIMPLALFLIGLVLTRFFSSKDF